jgi:hypothetical protein
MKLSSYEFEIILTYKYGESPFAYAGVKNKHKI